MTDEYLGLDFKLVERLGGVWILIWKNGGSRPAETTEVELWVALRNALAREKR